MRVVLVLALAVLFSCGGCDDDSDNGKVSQIDDEEFADVLGTFCETLDRCPDISPYPITYRSRGECAQILNFSITCRLEEIPGKDAQFTIRKRAIDLDKETSEACIAWLQDTPCDQIISGGEQQEAAHPCSDLFAVEDDSPANEFGDGDLNEACESDRDCQEPFFCTGGQFDDGTENAICRVCRPRLGDGASCQTDIRDCADGLVCLYKESGPRLCGAPLTDGADCTGSFECESGFCNGNLGMDIGGWGACDPNGNVGDSCTSVAESAGMGCRPELFCDNDVCAERRVSGSDCSSPFACQIGVCTDGICGIADGENCSEHDQCLSEICEDSVCVANDGTKCTSDAMCGSGETCEGLCEPPNCSCSGCPVGTCQPTAGENNTQPSTCEDDFDCLLGRCENGTCTETTIGSSCSQSFECYPLGFCENGTCAERKDPGESCGAIDSCKEPFLCKNGTCELINLSCEPASAGEECVFLQVCDDSSYCDLLDNFTCKSRKAVGESCGSAIPSVETCVANAFCVDGTCQLRPTLGEACDSVPCGDESFCVNGMCQGGPVGQPCEWWEDNPCPDDLRCDQELEICIPPKTQGEFCRDNEECAAGFFCQDYDTCQPGRAVGGECNDNFECEVGAFCLDGQCASQRAAGEMCGGAGQCQTGLICEFDGESTVCQTGRANGENCFANEECLSGSCYQGTVCTASNMCELPE